MLNNLSIRDRLTLILLGPLVVLLAIAALAVRDNLSTSSATNDAAFRVEMAQVNGRLFEAVRLEAAANQRAVAVVNIDLSEVRAETDAASQAWLERIDRYRDLDVDGLMGDIADIGDHREAQSANFASGAAGAEPVYGADIALMQDIASFDGRLNGRGESVSAAGLLKASQLTDAQLAVADAQLLGLWAAYTGEIPSSALASQLDAADATLTAYANRAQADQQVAATSDAYSNAARTLSDAVVGDQVSVEPDQWSDVSEAHAAAISETKQALLLQTGAEVNDEASSARSNMRNIGLLALAGLLVGAAILFIVVRSLRKSLEQIDAEATALAKGDLPNLAQSLAAGRPLGSPDKRPLLDTTGNDEIAKVAESLNEIRRSTYSVAQQQTDLLQSGIAEMFVNLARRNQSLVDRQLEVIDELEAQERDSDRLAHLYRVDHLATRMRRNAESLLVLADNTTPRRRGEPVDLREVVRVAIGEVEDYRRIVPIALDEVRVAAHVAHDVAHLLSELMENATQSSPPGTVADVVGVNEPDGSYTIHVLDRGTGIDDERRAQLNSVLSEPPTNTLSMSKTLGLTVVGRLAKRMGLRVSLNPGTDGGTVATLSIPADVVAEWAGSTGRVAYTPMPDAPADAPTPAPVEPPAPVHDPVAAAPATPVPDVAPAPTPDPTPAPVFDEPAPTPVVFDEPAPTPVVFDEPAPTPVVFDEPAPTPVVFDEPAPTPVVFDEPAPTPAAFDEPAPTPMFDEPAPTPVVFDEPAAAPVVFDEPAPAPFQVAPLEDLAPLPSPDHLESEPGPAPEDIPLDMDAVDAISGLPPFPTLGPPESEPMPPSVADLPGDHVFGQHDPIPAAEGEYAPPPSLGDVFGTDNPPESFVVDNQPAPTSAPEVPFDPVDMDPGEVFTLPDADDFGVPPGADPFAESDASIAEPAADPFAELQQMPAPDEVGPDESSMPSMPPPEPMAPTVDPGPAPTPAHAAPPLQPTAPTAEHGPAPSMPAHAAPVPEPPTPERVPAHAASPFDQPVGQNVDMAPSPETPTTAAGLVKRTRGASSIPDVTGPSGDRAAPSKRSPDQVKNMLSRYKTGLQRGRSTTEGEGHR